jgi:alpha-ribazole phosphatase
MRLWLCRHAPVQLEAGLCYGASDVPADPWGTQLAAQQLAQVLPTACPLWASPLRRTRQLAEALGVLRPDLPEPVWQPSLQEMDFGYWEMQSWSVIGHAAVDEWVSDFAHHRVGGAESTQAVVTRVQAALLQARHEAQIKAWSEMAWITHAGVIRGVYFLARHGPDAPITLADWPQEAPVPGAYGCLDME